MSDGTVHIVDDDQAVRKSLTLLVESEGMTAREYEHGQDFLDRYEPDKPECLLLDLRMPGMDGLEVLRELQRRGANVATVFLSGHGDIPIAVRALREGALDFVEKPFNNENLIDRLQVCIDTDAERERTRIDQQDARRRLEALTDREREVVDKLVAGKSNKLIAADLNISTRTVESHRARITRKLEVKSLSDIFKLVLAARENGEAAG